MTTWILIITLVSIGPTRDVAVMKVDGFHSPGTCERAANIYLTDIRMKNKLFSVSATCVPVN